MPSGNKFIARIGLLTCLVIGVAFLFSVSTPALVVAALAALAVGAWLFVRWRLVVQVCVFDRYDGARAFREAAALSRGAWVASAKRCAVVLGILSVLVFGAAGIQQLAAWLTLSVVGTGDLSLVVSFGMILVLRTLISAGVTSLGAIADAIVFTKFYRRRRHETGGKPPLGDVERRITSHLATPRWAVGLAAALVVGLTGAAGVSADLAVGAFGREGPITVTAHRGNHRRAPENTVAAVREAMTVGADYAEIDVQLSEDGVMVVTHVGDNNSGASTGNLENH